MSKGSAQRPNNLKKYAANADAIQSARGCTDKARRTPCARCNCYLLIKPKDK